MKFLKRITTAALSAVMMTASLSAGLTAQAASNTDRPVRMSTVLSNWTARINEEKQKFPHGSYWNGGDEDSTTNSPCDHYHDTYRQCNHTFAARSISDQRHFLRSEYDEDRYGNPYSSLSQCCGFARKLGKDLFQTNDFVRYYIKNSKMEMTAGTTTYYEPKVGDHVRLFSDTRSKQGHSIFITKISGNQIYFAECNGDLASCQILWDQTRYVSDYTTNQMVTVNKAYLRKNAVFVERPYIAGDFNLNGRIDSADVQVYKETMVDKGSKLKGSMNVKAASNADYDVNGSMRIDAYDYYAIQQYASSSTVDGYIVGSCDDRYIDCYHNEVLDKYFLYNGGIYQQVDFYKATFISPFCRDDITFSVPAKVTDPDTGKTFTVTEIGERDLSPRTTAVKLSTVASLGIPNTVTTINKYAFRHTSDQKLQHLYFTGSNPQLTTIGDYAFAECRLLNMLDFSDCNKLTKIGEQAFPKTLSTLFMPYVSSGSSQPTPTLGTTGVLAPDQSSNVTMIFKNNTSSYRKIVLNDKDLAYWRSGKLSLAVTGKTRLYDKNNTLLKTYN